MLRASVPDFLSPPLSRKIKRRRATKAAGGREVTKSLGFRGSFAYPR